MTLRTQNNRNWIYGFRHGHERLPARKPQVVCAQLEVCIRHTEQVGLLPEALDEQTGEILLRPSSLEDA
jgi:hypothetical protein